MPQAKEPAAGGIRVPGMREERNIPVQTAYVREHGQSLYTTPSAQLAKDPSGVNGASIHDNDDVRLRFTWSGGNDGRGAPLFKSLTQWKRTDTSGYQQSFYDQRPPSGMMGRAWRKYVSGKAPPY